MAVPAGRRAVRARRARLAVAPLFFAILFVAILFAATSPPSVAAPEEPAAGAVLAAGDPPLTAGMVERHARLLEWVLDAPLTAAQRDELREHLVDAWRRGDRPSIEAHVAFLDLRDRVFALPEAQRDLLRAQALPALLEQWRADAERDPAARWLLAVRDAAHRPLVAGDPPLTRQVSDAYAESLVFAAREITARPFEANGAFKDAVAARLAAAYPEMTPEARRALSQAPLLWAALRTAWPGLPEGERGELRRRWAASLGIAAPGPAMPREVAAALRALEELARTPRTSPLTPDEMRRVANRMEIVAEHLRMRGSAEEVRLAARYEEAARGFRASAAAPTDPGAPSGDSYEEAMALQRRQHRAFVALANASLTAHVGRMNMIAIMGGSPYRYSVR